MFEKVWLIIQAQMVALQQSLEMVLSGSGTAAIGTGIILIIFWCYAGYKIYELWTSQGGDSFGQKLFWAWKESRKAFAVYVLMVAAPILVGTLGNVARGYARKSTMVIIKAATPAFARVDEMVDEARGLFDGLGAMLAANAGQQDLTRRTLYQAAKGVITTDLTLREKALLQDGGSAQSAAIRFFQKGIATQRAILDSAVASKNPQAIAAAQAAFNDYRKTASDAMAKASDAGANVYLSLDQRRAKRKDELWAVIQGEWYDQYLAGKDVPENDPKRATQGFQNWDFFTNGSEAPDQRRMVLNQQLNATVEAELKAEEDRLAGSYGWTEKIPEIAWRVLGILGACICMIAILAAGMQIFKAAYGALMTCVSFVATVTFGFALAAPVSPAFMLCFLSEKTEHWGRNFVNFLLSGVFASLGLFLMVSGVGFLFRTITVAMLPQISLELMAVQAATVNLGDFFLSILRLGGYAMLTGMAITFTADLVKKGAAVGAGLFTGHFPV